MKPKKEKLISSNQIEQILSGLSNLFYITQSHTKLFPMSNPITLNGTMNPVTIHADGVTLLAPDLTGEISSTNDTTTRGDLRFFTKDEGEFDTILKAAALEHDLDIRYTFYMEVADDGVLHMAQTRKGMFLPMTSYGEEAIIMAVPARRNEKPIAVLHQDEAGILQWIFPEGDISQETQEVVFHIPRKSSENDKEGDLPEFETRAIRRGLFGRIIRVVTGVITKILTPVVKVGVELWERRNRAYDLSLIRGNVIEPNFRQWQLIKPTEKNPDNATLLLIHGTFVTLSGTFQPLLDSASMPGISTHYDNQVLGFQHPTLYHSPVDNVEELLNRLPGGVEFNFDIVTGSRGGLVARELIRRVATGDTRGRKIRINKVITIACCNQGTLLADDEHMVSFLNRYALMASLLPLGTLGTILSAILNVVKVLAGAALGGLPGLTHQRPFERNPFITSLNSSLEHPSRLFGIGANYNPQQFNLGRYLLNRTVDRVFQHEENDVVVPTKGCYDAAGTFGFPIQHEVFDESFDIFHLNYFRSEEVQRRIQQWLLSRDAVGV